MAFRGCPHLRIELLRKEGESKLKKQYYTKSWKGANLNALYVITDVQLQRVNEEFVAFVKIAKENFTL